MFEAAEPTLARIAVPGGEVVAFSVRGPEKTLNEDALAVLPCTGGVVLVACDGMGGHQAGERASRAAIETIAARVASAPADEAPRHTLIDGIEEANRAVLALGVGAGATIAATLIRETTARSAHVGDAAALHLGQRGRVKAQTVAHSPTGYAVEAGLLDEDEALHHEERHLVSNHLGDEGMRVEFGPSVPIAPRDRLVLASDGLLDNLRLDELIELARKDDPERAARRLADLATRRMLAQDAALPGKPDDLSFLLFRRLE